MTLKGNIQWVLCCRPLCLLQEFPASLRTPCSGMLNTLLTWYAVFVLVTVCWLCVLIQLTSLQTCVTFRVHAQYIVDMVCCLCSCDCMLTVCVDTVNESADLCHVQGSCSVLQVWKMCGGFHESFAAVYNGEKIFVSQFYRYPPPPPPLRYEMHINQHTKM